MIERPSDIDAERPEVAGAWIVTGDPGNLPGGLIRRGKPGGSTLEGARAAALSS